jgi:histidine triad (HIT) family protein
MENCKFCSILNNKLPSRIVYEDEDVIALLPKEVEVYGHTLVIPRTHYESLYDTPDEILGKLTVVAKKLAIQYQKTIGAT